MKCQEFNIIALCSVCSLSTLINATLSLLKTHAELQNFSHIKLLISVSRRMALDFPKREEDLSAKKI